MNVARTAVMVGAIMTTGLVTGVFVFYAHTVMPGLGKTDDRTFVAAFQALDRAIINPWFMGTGFVGALLFTVAAAVTHRGERAQWLLWAALGIYLVAVVITVAVQVPLNDALKAAGDVDRIADLATVRAQFDESRWAAWNLVRALCSLTSFGLLIVAAMSPAAQAGPVG